MRHYPRLDASQKAIVAALRAAGYDVLSLAALGGGAPDILVHRAGRLWLAELKRPVGPRGGNSEKGQKLNTKQIEFRQRWPVEVWRTRDEALAAVGAVSESERIA